VCDHRFEQAMSIHDSATPICPVCGSEVRKVFGSVGVTFKGSGFYRTDSREASKASSTASSTPSPAKSSSSE